MQLLNISMIFLRESTDSLGALVQFQIRVLLLLELLVFRLCVHSGRCTIYVDKMFKNTQYALPPIKND